ncbi:hypothetical protein BKA93DRAFT_466398 [Sparassis latifolia]
MSHSRSVLLHVLTRTAHAGRTGVRRLALGKCQLCGVRSVQRQKTRTSIPPFAANDSEFAHQNHSYAALMSNLTEFTKPCLFSAMYTLRNLPAVHMVHEQPLCTSCRDTDHYDGTQSSGGRTAVLGFCKFCPASHDPCHNVHAHRISADVCSIAIQHHKRTSYRNQPPSTGPGALSSSGSPTQVVLSYEVLSPSEGRIRLVQPRNSFVGCMCARTSSWT